MKRRSRVDRRRFALDAFTAARLLLVPPIILTFLNSTVITTACLGAFMVADLMDGVVARFLKVDDFERRSLDSVIDRVAIDACLVAAWGAHALPTPLLIGFLVRDVYCSALCIGMVRTREVIIKADLMYRALNCSIAAWALTAPLCSHGATSAIALGIFLASIIVAWDLTRCIRNLRHASLGRREVVRPKLLRGLGVRAGDGCASAEVASVIP